MIKAICDYCGKKTYVTLLKRPIGVYTYICKDCKLKGLFLRGRI